MSGIVIILMLLLFFTLFYLINMIFTRSQRKRNVSEAENKGDENNPDQVFGNKAPGNETILRNALDLSHVKLREIMVPRTEIEAVPVNSTVDHLREKFIATRFSRILVYQDTIDNIAGYCEVKDIFKNPPDIRSSIRKLAVVPETMPANRLLKMFVSEKRSIALVVDEFGGTSGMVTIEDLLEEIVGDIEDEHDTNDLVEKTVKPDEYIFSGRLEIDYLNEKYDLNLPESDDYATLAGMILYYHGRIPAINDIVRIGGFVIKILRASTTRLELVNLTTGS
jgi:CBS domain containing-hemolysin-like protein